jgi:hypothetical protein
MAPAAALCQALARDDEREKDKKNTAAAACSALAPDAAAVDAVGTRRELPLEQVQDIRIYIYISDAVAVDAVGTRTKELPLEQVQDIRIYIYISDAAAVDAVGTRRELPLEQVPYFYLDVDERSGPSLAFARESVAMR